MVYMATKTTVPKALRVGLPLKIGREWVPFGRNVIAPTDSTFELQHRLFVNDPWAVIAEAIHRALPDARRVFLAHMKGGVRNDCSAVCLAYTNARDDA